MRYFPLAIGAFVAFGLAPAVSAAPVAPLDAVGESIGTDLTIDTGFGDGGYTIVNYNDDVGTWDEVLRLLPADDGGFWMVGFHRPDAGNDSVAISKLDADGKIDTSYGLGGKMVEPTGVNLTSDAILEDGRFYVAGIHYLDTPGLGIFGVACLQLDGAPCPGFGDEGTVTIALNQPGFNSGATRILYRDGALYAIGKTDPGGPNGSSSAIAIAKLDAATGALDATFGNGSGPLPGTATFKPDHYPGGFDLAYAAAFAGNGDVLVGGSSQNNNNQGSDGYVLAINPTTGAIDPAFGTEGYAWFSFDTGVHFDEVIVRAIHVGADGRIIVAGDANHDDEFFNSLTGVLLASLEPDGTPVADFGVDGVTHVTVGLNTVTTDMAVRANGDLVVSMASSGLLPNPYTSDILQSMVQFDPSGNGPTATVSIEYPSQVGPQGRPTSLLVDSRDGVLVGGFRLWDFNFPIPDSDHVVTRLVRDGIFASGFEP